MPSYVITGASRGLGYEFVRQLSQDSSNTVIGLVRNKAATDEQLSKDGITNVTIYQADITDLPALQKAAAEAGTLLGSKGLDYLIANAGINPERTALLGLNKFEDQPEVVIEDMLDSFKTNTIGVVNLVSAFIPLVKRSQIKKVIIISTGMADMDLTLKYGAYMGAPYTASKAALNAINAKYQVAYAAQGVLFLAVSPGFVATSMNGPGDLPPHLLPGLNDMLAGFVKYKPDFAGPITPKESVEHVLSLAERATVEEFGGKFVSHFGTNKWL